MTLTLGRVTPPIWPLYGPLSPQKGPLEPPKNPPHKAQKAPVVPNRPRIVGLYNHPEVNRIWVIGRICYGSFKDHILSTPGWLYVNRGSIWGVTLGAHGLLSDLPGRPLTRLGRSRSCKSGI